jgi:hypothetical protein
VTQALSWPIDPSFKRTDARLPFNWALRSPNAEFEAGGGLYASYSGRGREALVEQIVMMGPGRYILTAEMSGQIELRSGIFGWSVTCEPSRTEIGLLRIETLTATPAPYATTLVVPREGCAAQRLTFLGLPGEFPRRARATVARLTLTPATADAPSPAGQAP